MAISKAKLRDTIDKTMQPGSCIISLPILHLTLIDWYAVTCVLGDRLTCGPSHHLRGQMKTLVAAYYYLSPKQGVKGSGVFENWNFKTPDER